MLAVFGIERVWGLWYILAASREQGLARTGPSRVLPAQRASLIEAHAGKVLQTGQKPFGAFAPESEVIEMYLIAIAALMFVLSVLPGSLRPVSSERDPIYWDVCPTIHENL